MSTQQHARTIWAAVAAASLALICVLPTAPVAVPGPRPDPACPAGMVSLVWPAHVTSSAQCDYPQGY